MDSLHSEWQRLSKRIDFLGVLDDYLLAPDDELPWQPDINESELPAAKRQKTFKYQNVHADFKRQHGVARFFWSAFASDVVEWKFVFSPPPSTNLLGTSLPYQS